MNINEIKRAVNNGSTVCWLNEGFEVKKNDGGQYFIIHKASNNLTGLTNIDGVTLNGRDDDFFIKPTYVQLKTALNKILNCAELNHDDMEPETMELLHDIYKLLRI